MDEIITAKKTTIITWNAQTKFNLKIYSRKTQKYSEAKRKVVFGAKSRGIQEI